MRCARCNRRIKPSRYGYLPVARGEGRPCPVAFVEECAPPADEDER